MRAVLGIDTSCYTTSAALVSVSGRLIASSRRLLTVDAGERGLMQSEGLFQHVKNLPDMIGSGVKENAADLDAEISACLRGWTIQRLSRVDLAILRLSVYEMKYAGLAPAISINEAVELTRKYSSESSCSFVNGVLGTISRKLAAKA